MEIKNIKILLLMLFLLMIVIISNSYSRPKESKSGAYSEYSPTISADGKTMIFQTDQFTPGKYKIAIKYKKEGEWTDPVLLDNVNSEYLDGGCFITYDQNQLIITSNRKGGMGSTDLWISNREGDNWTVPENFGVPINSSEYEGFASLSPDGKSLYFLRLDPSKKKCDNDKFSIYYSEKKFGRWTDPERMPFPVNSEYCEFGPAILADGVTLIFSSSRPGGKGDYDLYKVEKLSDGTWGELKNLGDFINTGYEDSLITIPASGDIMYYTKAIEEGSDVSRIFSVPIPEDLQQHKVITVYGQVKDAKDPSKLLSAQLSIQDEDKKSSVKVIESNKKDGKYIIILNKGFTYDFSVNKKGYTFYSDRIDLEKIDKYEELQKDILLEPIKAGTSFVLNNLLFKYKSFKLKKSSKYELIRIINILNSNPKMVVEIGGHTDNIGSPEYNMDLSKKRARSVVKYLIKYGADTNQIKAKGYGMTNPLSDNSTEEGRKKNRRVEMKILSVD